jgi:hypothetical protein
MLLLALSATLAVSADPLPGFRYEDATKFQIINKGWDNTTEPYTRLPQQYMDSCREEQQWLYNHSSGIAVRFATNSKRIAAQYNLKNNFHMQHMAMTGIKGTDLYYLNEERNVWEHVNTARPQEKNFKADSIQSKLYVENLDGEMHEYMIYLPLYDGINWLQIGVDSTAELIQPQVENPRKMGKIVIYGTSIQQGGCASRVGMVPSAMIQREYNLECVNLSRDCLQVVVDIDELGVGLHGLTCVGCRMLQKRVLGVDVIGCDTSANIDEPELLDRLRERLVEVRIEVGLLVSEVESRV